jgi:hypothetical protein|tara:strand:- start:62459 stop:62620 length:162 start_codon:yes stop_codon:yes gene_type:complete
MQIKQGVIMGKFFKYFFYLTVLTLTFLVGYSFFGDLSAPTTLIIENIPIPNEN